LPDFRAKSAVFSYSDPPSDSTLLVGQFATRRDKLDYECDGTAHCLRFKWRHTDGDSGEVLDQRTYILSPGRGLIGHERD